MKLALGTAQFGLDYGITNSNGRPDDVAVRKILACASDSGIEMLDTARSYGASEELLGRILDVESSFKIITKTQPVGNQHICDADIQRVRDGVEQSFQRLQRDNIYAIMVHHATELLLPQGERIFDILQNLKQKKRIAKIGISVYSPEIVEKIMDRYPLDLIQIPLNLVDQRMAKSGILKKLKHYNVEIHVRSAFLQGVLLSDISKLPIWFSPIFSQLSQLKILSKQTGLSKMSLALGFLKQLPEVDKVVVGVLDDQQLAECITAINTDVPEEIDYGVFECQDLSIIDPSKW